MIRISNKNLLIAVLSLILLFSISCDNENKTGGGEISSGGGSAPPSERTLSYYAGEWESKTSTNNRVIIYSNGSTHFRLEGSADIDETIPYMTRVNDTNYKCNYTNSRFVLFKADLQFSTDTDGYFKIDYKKLYSIDKSVTNNFWKR